jgi:hypothetical protein
MVYRRTKRDREIDQEAARSRERLNTYRSGDTLYSMAMELKITPVQAVVQYFAMGRGHYKVKDDYRGLLKILSLLKECDWELDPAIRVNEGCDRSIPTERWVEWDPERPGLTTTEIRCQEDLVERFIKPLLGDTFDFAKVLQQLAQGDFEGAKREVKTALEAKAQEAGDNPLAGHGIRQTEQQRNPETGLFMTAREAESQPLGEHGGVPRADDSPRSSDRTSGIRGETQTYLLRRLARDAPEVLERVKAGEFRSARAAAIEAGIIKPVPTIRLVDDIGRVAAALRKHLDQAQRVKLAEALLQ